MAYFKSSVKYIIFASCDITIVLSFGIQFIYMFTKCYVVLLNDNIIIFNLPNTWLRTVRPSSPKQALLASKGFVNCTKAYPLCIDIPVNKKDIIYYRTFELQYNFDFNYTPCFLTKVLYIFSAKRCFLIFWYIRKAIYVIRKVSKVLSFPKFTELNLEKMKLQDYSFVR